MHQAAAAAAVAGPPSNSNQEEGGATAAARGGDVAPGGFSVDLLRDAAAHLAFLRRMHPLIHSLGAAPSTREESLRRYRDLWLPLVVRHPDVRLAPPPDAAWLWHCHRLAPLRHASYVKARFGRARPPLEARPPFCFQEADDGGVCGAGKGEEGGGSSDAASSLAEETRRLWKESYPDEPFFLSDDGGNASPPSGPRDPSSSSSLGGFDLLASAERQSTFLWQVSGPRFADNDFLRDAVRQYRKFLLLRRSAPRGATLVPTYQIDLMWHTHILSSAAGYFADCTAIAGAVLNHDDSLDDRTEGGPLDRAFEEMKALWEGTYGEEYFVAGGMYRGEPPAEYYSPEWEALPSSSSSTGFASAEHRRSRPTGPFLRMIDVQGASSTDPTGGARSDPPRAIWAWKETPGRMPLHAPGDVVGDPAHCWIRYDDVATGALEAAFGTGGGGGTCDLGNGYSVDLAAMEQTNARTGYRRDVRRHVEVVDAVVPSTVMPVLWCWKETPGRGSDHPASSFFGDPGECWIKYDGSAVAKLESAFQAQGQRGECSPVGGYVVNFATMTQRNLSTGYEREVRRVDPDAVRASFGNPFRWYWRSFETDDRLRHVPHGRWVEYDAASAARLESAFLAQGRTGTCSPVPAYVVDFATMKQTNVATGHRRDVQRADGGAASLAPLVSWTPFAGTAPDGWLAFEPANAKATTRGANANPFKDRYVFGRKSNNAGYFHISTREAYEVLSARIGVRLRRKKGQSLLLQGVTFGMMDKKSKIQELQYVKAIADARAASQTPAGIVGLPPEIQNDPSKRSLHYGDAGDWYFPKEYYSAAGGCGESFELRRPFLSTTYIVRISSKHAALNPVSFFRYLSQGAGTVRGGGGGSASAGGGCGAAACTAAVSWMHRMKSL